MSDVADPIATLRQVVSNSVMGKKRVAALIHVIETAAPVDDNPLPTSGRACNGSVAGSRTWLDAQPVRAMVRRDVAARISTAVLTAVSPWRVG